MRWFLPVFERTFTFERIPDDFKQIVADRVEAGLLSRGNLSRAAYSVRRAEGDAIHFGADDMATAINVGLNEVIPRRVDSRTMIACVSYWTWLAFCAAICLSLAVSFLAAYALIPPLREALNTSVGMILLFWGMLLFWGVPWPFLLASLHKGPAAHCLARILREEFEGVPAQEAGLKSQSGDYVSPVRLFGLPLLHVASTGTARGFLAIGAQQARGVIAIGGMAWGGLAIGGLAFGVVAIGGLAAGGVAIGGVATGGVAIGGQALGFVAIGGNTLGAS